MSARAKGPGAKSSRRVTLPLRSDDTGRFLPAIVGIMTFLAMMALAAALGVGGAVARWDRQLTGSATVQIAAVDDPALVDARVQTAVGLLRGMPGILRAEPLSREAAAALIQPWLGDAALDPDLPLPRLIDVVFDPGRLDLGALRQALSAVPGSSFDDHLRWVEGLRRIARSGTLLALGVLALIGLAAALSVVFSTRSGLAVQHDVIDVLHTIGARDRDIANGYARHAMLLALRGGIVGGVLAGGLLVALGLGIEAPTVGMLPALRLAWSDWVLLALLPLAAAVIAGLTARQTVLATLGRLP